MRERDSECACVPERKREKKREIERESGVERELEQKVAECSIS